MFVCVRAGRGRGREKVVVLTERLYEKRRRAFCNVKHSPRENFRNAAKHLCYVACIKSMMN